MTQAEDSGGLLTLLSEWRAGNTASRDQLFASLYSELRAISAALLAGERAITLSTGDLVNEASIRLIQITEVEWKDRAHFVAMSARVMRRILIDHARAKATDKRGHKRVTLVTQFGDNPPEQVEFDHLDKALTRLDAIDPQRAMLVELRYFGGLSIEETAEAMGLSPASVKRSWRVSRAWLQEAIAESKRMADLS